MFQILLASVLLFYGLYRYYKKERIRTHIPEPWGLPVLGHLPFLGFEPHKTFLKWKETYGPIVKIRMGHYPTVVISDGALIKKAFAMPELSGRPRIEFYDRLTGRTGIGWRDGPEQTKMRQFVIKSFKDIGYGGRSMEEKLVDQIPEVLEIFGRDKGPNQPVPVKNEFSASLVNYIWSISMGKKFKRGDPRFEKLVRTVNQAAAVPPLVALAVFIPFIGKLFPRMTGLSKMERDVKEGDRFMSGEIVASKAILEHNSSEDDNNKLLLKDIMAVQGQLPILRDEALPHLFFDIFAGSTETTSGSMEWLIYYMAKYPRIQERFQQEIDECIGKDRLPAISDRANMPFAQAVIQEMLRKATPFPLGIVHSALEDTLLEGYLIPKGTMIMPNVWGVHNDPGFWGDPEVFRPERFLDEGGKLVSVSEHHFLPFSTGKRMCIGETLGRNQIFLYITSILQKYKVKAGGELPLEKGELGFTYRPHQFSVIATLRS